MGIKVVVFDRVRGGEAARLRAVPAVVVVDEAGVCVEFLRGVEIPRHAGVAADRFAERFEHVMMLDARRIGSVVVADQVADRAQIVGQRPERLAFRGEAADVLLREELIYLRAPQVTPLQLARFADAVQVVIDEVEDYVPLARKKCDDVARRALLRQKTTRAMELKKHARCGSNYFTAVAQDFRTPAESESPELPQSLSFIARFLQFPIWNPDTA